MNQYLRDLIWDECIKADNFIQIPGIYRHFKLEKDYEDMIYAVSNISVPIFDEDEFSRLFNDKNSHILSFYHTELEETIYILRNKDRYYHHNSYDKEKLVIYTALYDDRKTYLRPLSMFLSRVDKQKYPNAVFKNRLELAY